MADTPEEGVNVNVILRCRPPNAQEIAERAPQVIQCNETLREVTLYQNINGKQMSRTFRYDKVFGPDSQQERVYQQSISPIVTEVLEGFNCTIFAYGQTGTGKTFTMEGGPRNSVDGSNMSPAAGIIPRAIKQIFDAIVSNDVTDSSVKVSYMELYNEELTDLLSMDNDKDKRLRLLEDRSGVVVQGLEEVVVKSAAEIFQVLDRGTAKRRTAETLLNKSSSRSHSVFTITIHMKETTPEGEDVIKIGKLNLVDLAGSENISRSGAKDSRAREAGNINQSLLTLGRVITALVEHSGHVPYRDSKLTRLLRDSLGGKTKTCIIATIGPSVVCAEETVSTLDYAHRAKNIRNRPELNQRISKTTMIKELTTEIERLKMDLVATREKNGIYISVERYDAYELERVQLREAVMKHKAETDTITQEHQLELDGIKAAYEGQLAAAQAQVAELQQRVHVTELQLAEAQVTIQEGRFVILSQQRAEQAIAAHAVQVTTELGSTAADLSDVFGRLSSALQVTGGDRDALKGICELAGSKLGKLQTSLVAAARAQGAMLEGMKSQVEGFQQRKEQEMQALTSQLQQLQSTIDSTQQLMTTALSSQAEAAGQALSSAQAAQAASADDMSQALQAARQAVAGALDSLSSSLQAQSTQLVQFAQQQQDATADAQNAAAAGLLRAKEGLESVGNSVQQLHGVAQTTNDAVNSKLAAFAADFEATMAEKQQALVAQLGSLLATFVSERQEAVAGAVAEVQQHLEAGQQKLSQAAAVAAAAVDGCGNKLAAVNTAGQQSTQELQRALAAGVEQAAGGVADTLSRVQQLATQHSAHTKTVADKLEMQTKGMSTLTSDSAAKMSAGAKQTSQQIAGAVDQLHSCQQSMASAAQDSHSADTALATKLAAAAVNAGKEATAAAGQHSNMTTDVVNSIVSNTQARLAQQPPTLPEEKTVDVPDVEVVAQLCCPPEPVLLEHFRAQRQHVVERGGDPVEVFGVVLPSDGGGSSQGSRSTTGPVENEPPSPTSSLRSSVCSEGGSLPAAGSKRSRIPTLGGNMNVTTRAGFSDKTNQITT